MYIRSIFQANSVSCSLSSLVESNSEVHTFHAKWQDRILINKQHIVKIILYLYSSSSVYNLKTLMSSLLCLNAEYIIFHVGLIITFYDYYSKGEKARL